MKYLCVAPKEDDTLCMRPARGWRLVENVRCHLCEEHLHEYDQDRAREEREEKENKPS